MRLKLRRYYLPDPRDSMLAALRKRLTRRRVPPFPRTLQIQTATGCNADCVFCPYGRTHDSQPKGRMDWDLFRKIVDESARHRVRRISPYLMNEPFADPELFERIAYINRSNPRARVVITTNGSLLGPRALDRLLALGAGVHELAISVQGIDPAAYKLTMGGSLDLGRTLANVERLIEAVRGRRRRPRLWITMVDSGLIDARRAVAYWRSRGVACRTTRLENRGGNVPEAAELARAPSMEALSSCTRLFKQMYVLFDGDVVLCCTDYARAQVLGNVRKRSLYEVWNGEPALEIRRKFLAGCAGELPLCGPCRIDRQVEVEERAPLNARFYPREPSGAHPPLISTVPY